MGMTDRLERRSLNPENPSTDLRNPASWLVNWIGGRARSASGVLVNERTALRYAAVYSCVRILAETISSLPFITYEQLENGGKKRARDHYLYDLLRTQPNPQIPGPMPFYELLQGHLGTWGNAFAEIEFVGGRPVALWPLPPDRTYAVRKDGVKWIITKKNDGTPVKLPSEQVLHIPGWGYDGIMGYSPIHMLAESIGVGMAAQKAAGLYYANGGAPSGVLKHPKTLSAEAQQRLVDTLEARHGGLENKHRMMVLEEGLDWQSIGLPAKDVLMLDAIEFEVEEIARAYRIPTVLLGITEKSTTWGTGVDAFQTMFTTHTIRPWAVRWEGALKHALILPSDQAQGYYVEILLDAILRGDLSSRYESYTKARQWGWMSADDVRSKEGMNPLPDGQGETYLVPMNMIPADMAGNVAKPKPTNPPPAPSGAKDADPVATEREGDAPDTSGGGVSVTTEAEREQERLARVATMRQRVRAAHQKALTKAADGVVRREVNAIKRQVKKTIGADENRSSQDLRAWLDEFYSTEPVYVREAFAEHLTAYYIMVRGAVADELGVEDPGSDLTAEEQAQLADYVDALANRYAASSKGQLDALMNDAEDEAAMEALISTRLDEWQDTKAEKYGRRESARAGNAFASFAYGVYAVANLRWLAVGKSCDLCEQLSGQIISRGAAFVPDGTVMKSATQAALTIRGHVGHPPLHDGCDCIVVAA